MCRQEYNLMIVHAIEKSVMENPELRFIQLLWKLGVVDREDRFYEESEETFKKVVGR